MQDIFKSLGKGDAIEAGVTLNHLLLEPEKDDTFTALDNACWSRYSKDNGLNYSDKQIQVLSFGGKLGFGFDMDAESKLINALSVKSRSTTLTSHSLEYLYLTIFREQALLCNTSACFQFNASVSLAQAVCNANIMQLNHALLLSDVRLKMLLSFNYISAALSISEIERNSFKTKIRLSQLRNATTKNRGDNNA